jgi:NADH:ubiquinone oxidoreductase subunit K
MTQTKLNISWLYDDLLAWLCPGGLLLTALMLRFPHGLHLLREQAPELTLPTWFAGAYVIGLALSPLGRIVYAAAQAIVWPYLRSAWSPAVAFLAERLMRDEALTIPAAETMSVHVFHDVDRRMREYLEAVDPTSRSALNRMKVLCSLSCNSAAACVVFIMLDALAGNIPTWTISQIAAASLTTGLAFVAAVYRERRRQRTQLSVWRRCQITDRITW